MCVESSSNGARNQSSDCPIDRSRPRLDCSIDRRPFFLANVSHRELEFKLRAALLILPIGMQEQVDDSA